MKRLLGVSVAVVGVCAAVMVATCRPAQPAAEVYPTTVVSGPTRYHFSDLPRDVYKGIIQPGQTVSISYPFRLRPTADPHTFHFHPGSATLPPTHRIVFDTPPDELPCPVVVTGTVGGIDTDGRVRHNNVPGCLVIRRASVLSPSTP